jgi:hypothetical protein
MSRATYAIRVSGELPHGVLDNFEGVTSIAKSMDTALRADLADPAALHGLLRALRGAGLVLLEVRRELPTPPDPPPAGGQPSPA